MLPEIRDALTCAGQRSPPPRSSPTRRGSWRPRSRGAGGRRTGRSAIRGRRAAPGLGVAAPGRSLPDVHRSPGPRHHRLRSFSTAILMILDRCMRCCDPSDPVYGDRSHPPPLVSRPPSLPCDVPARALRRLWQRAASDLWPRCHNHPARRRLGRWIISDKTGAYPTTGPAPPGRLTKCGCRVRYAMTTYKFSRVRHDGTNSGATGRRIHRRTGAADRGESVAPVRMLGFEFLCCLAVLGTLVAPVAWVAALRVTQSLGVTRAPGVMQSGPSGCRSPGLRALGVTGVRALRALGVTGARCVAAAS